MNHIIQWNLNGFWPRYSELKQLIYKYNTPIIALQETHLLPKHTIHMNKYNIFRFDNLTNQIASGGAALFINTSIQSKEIHLQSSFQCVAAQVYLPKVRTKPISICSIYIPPSQVTTKQDFEQLLYQLPPPFIIAGDLNALRPT